MSPTPPPPVRVREVLDLALERPARERAAFIAGVCGEDERLRDEVVSLMRALETGGELLEPPPAAPGPAAEPLTGLRFGAYHVAERVGEGGMGVVYRAEDTRLGRAVAVKALPATLARDPHRRARFEHEARILASLSHPNIAAIHGVEDTARGPVLVLEFVPGETLAQRLTRGPLALDAAVATAIQIARGLEAAHAAGIVHRDLRPSNIQLTPEGGVKILDFGVAKQAPPISELDASPSPLATVVGSLVGTAAYMSPEQARGRPVDRRADLWAFGCVLYEMLTGRRAFDGETPSDTVASVLRADPDWSRLPRETPAPLHRLLRRCLEKDPDQRQRDAGDARLELDGRDEPAPLQAPRRHGLWLTAAALLTAAIASTAWLMRAGAVRPALSAPVHFELHAAPDAPIYLTTGGAMAIAPDGRSLVYAGGDIDRSRLYSRRFDAHETIEVPGTDGVITPCFSPDGRWIAFNTERQVMRRVPAAGGGAEDLVSTDVSPVGLAWDEHGIAYCGINPWGLRRVVPGRAPQLLVELDPVREMYTAHPEPLPGGDVFLLTIVTVEQERVSPRVESIRVRTGERRTVVTEAAGARFLPPDRLVFWQAGTLVAARFDPGTLHLTEAPVPLVRPLAGGEFHPPRRFAVSPSGVLATLPGNIRYDLTRLAWLELPGGSWTEITQGESFDSPRVSPDGTRVAMLIGLARSDVWVHDLVRGTKMVLASGGHCHHVVWTPDSRSLVFTSNPPHGRCQIVRLDADGGGSRLDLWQASNGLWAHPTDCLPDGRILLTIDELGVGPDLHILDPRTGEAPHPLMPTPGHRYGARVSRDGTMIAYTSEETGSMEVYLHRFPSLEGKIRVSTNGGYRPVWADNDTKIFFRYVDKVMVADVNSGGGRISVSPPRLVAEHLPDARYDVDAEGRRLLMPRPVGDLGPQTRINVVVGWDPRTPMSGR
ncbi:MAG: protein kinase domain-containing protein [Phycisphaerales bacterium]